MAMALSSRRFYVLCNKSILFKFTQRRRIMASPFRKEKAIEELKNNPYYEKYAQKIATFQNTSPEEFLSRLKEINELKTKPKANTPEERKFSSLSDPKVDITKDSSPTYTKQKVLNDVMKMELIADKDGEEIKQIWQEYHKHKNVIAATIPSAMYDTIHERSLKFPVFLFPLPRDKGYEFILCQFSGHESHFTPLINYQTHKENSPECLTMTHYTDIKEKGLVLMRGEYNKDILNGSEAQCLANQLQLYYGQDNTKRLQLLERFTYRPQEFKHMDLIAELECLTL
ncbi:ATP synthase mitochondrial F1 complex assembly factor 1 isoform X1 [Periplaneta americana]|uniref:ATP synthase mitochondrial F1 complex assembly factor 1 isoform X1 n=1 Tax=Periplaneta americana TaxID=6978 RepID=UPI0037E87C96